MIVAAVVLFDHPRWQGSKFLANWVTIPQFLPVVAFRVLSKFSDMKSTFRALGKLGHRNIAELAFAGKLLRRFSC
jgi:hypothetical protein